MVYAQAKQGRPASKETCEPMKICKISPSQTVATSTKTPSARKSSLKLPALPSRTTRATAAAAAEAARPKHSPTDINRYIASHNTPTKKGNNSWNVVNNKIILLEDHMKLLLLYQRLRKWLCTIHFLSRSRSNNKQTICNTST